ncbi:MAG: serine/threonine protein kinase, partial [Mycobacterium sp.]|nr:serine/threonine protein kinase [Mycobacterium sp.]
KFVSAMRAAAAAAALVGGYAWVCPATAAADSNSDALAKMMSQGYTTSNCTAAQGTGGLAAYECGQSPLPNGPTKALYILFGNSADTSAGFQGAIGDITAAPCKSGDPVPDTWSFDSSSNTAAGQIACGTTNNDNVSMVIWTNDQNHMVGAIGGSNQAALYQWWQADG